METNLQSPQQLALRDKKLFVVQDAFLAQFIQITQTFRNVFRRYARRTQLFRHLGPTGRQSGNTR